jgi:ribokinase
MTVLVFGSVNVDLTFRLERLPGVGETVIGPGYAIAPGGKGANQALAAARAGAAAVRLCAAIGNDAFADEALRELRAEGVDLSAVRRVERPTGCASIGVDAAGRNQIMVAAGANAAASSDAVPDTWLGPDTILVLQMEVPWTESLRLARRARRSGARVCLNLAPFLPIAPAELDDVDFLIVNETEARALAAAVAASDGSAASLAASTGRAVIVTRGANGVVYAGGAERCGAPALAVEPVDTTGAGDAFVGAFAASIDRGAPIPEALAFAAAAGSLACLAPGAQAGLPRRGAIDAGLRTSPTPSPWSDA